MMVRRTRTTLKVLLVLCYVQTMSANYALPPLHAPAVFSETLALSLVTGIASAFIAVRGLLEPSSNVAPKWAYSFFLVCSCALLTLIGRLFLVQAPLH